MEKRRRVEIFVSTGVGKAQSVEGCRAKRKRRMGAFSPGVPLVLKTERSIALMDDADDRIRCLLFRAVAAFTLVLMLHSPCLFASDILETRLAMEMAVTEGRLAGTVVFSKEASLIFGDLFPLDSEDKYRWEYAWRGAEQWHFSFVGKADSLSIKRNGPVIEKNGVKWDARYFDPRAYPMDRDKLEEFRKNLYPLRVLPGHPFRLSEGRMYPGGIWGRGASMTEKVMDDSLVEITFAYEYVYPRGAKSVLTLDRNNGCMPVLFTYTLPSPSYESEYVRILDLLRKGVPADSKTIGMSLGLLRWPRYEYSDPVSVKVKDPSGVFVIPRVCCAHINMPDKPLLWRSEIDVEQVALDRTPDETLFQLDPKIQKVEEFREAVPRRRSVTERLGHLWNDWMNFWFDM